MSLLKHTLLTCSSPIYVQLLPHTSSIFCSQLWILRLCMSCSWTTSCRSWWWLWWIYWMVWWMAGSRWFSTIVGVDLVEWLFRFVFKGFCSTTIILWSVIHAIIILSTFGRPQSLHVIARTIHWARKTQTPRLISFWEASWALRNASPFHSVHIKEYWSVLANLGMSHQPGSREDHVDFRCLWNGPQDWGLNSDMPVSKID